jgi:hypothetical protein
MLSAQSGLAATGTNGGDGTVLQERVCGHGPYDCTSRMNHDEMHPNLAFFSRIPYKKGQKTPSLISHRPGYKIK